MKLTIGRGSAAQSITFATGKGWSKDDTTTLLGVMKNVGFIPSAVTKKHKARMTGGEPVSHGYVAQ